MSDFDYMHVVFHHTDRDDARSIEITSGMDTERVESVFAAILGAGWFNTGVEINEESYDVPDSSLVPVAGALLDCYDADAVIGFGETFGWDNDAQFSEGRYGQREYMDAYHGAHESEADWAEEFVKDCYSLDIPDFVEIDWEATAENLSQDMSFYHAPDGTVHVFSSNW